MSIYIYIFIHVYIYMYTLHITKFYFGNEYVPSIYIYTLSSTSVPSMYTYI